MFLTGEGFAGEGFVGTTLAGGEIFLPVPNPPKEPLVGVKACLIEFKTLLFGFFCGLGLDFLFLALLFIDSFDN